MRENKQKKRIEEWDRLARFEKIMMLREKMQGGEKMETEKEKDESQRWSTWRAQSPAY